MADEFERHRDMLATAIQQGNDARALALIGTPYIIANEYADAAGAYTYLAYAAVNYRLRPLIALHEKGADIDALGRNNGTALMAVAARIGPVETDAAAKIIEYLLVNGADPNLVTDRYSAFHWLCEYPFDSLPSPRTRALEFFLDNGGDLTSQDADLGDTALFRIMRRLRASDGHVIDQLMEYAEGRALDVNTQGQNGFRAIDGLCFEYAYHGRPAVYHRAKDWLLAIGSVPMVPKAPQYVCP